MTHLTQSELELLRELAKANPRVKLVDGVTGACTCDGYAIEMFDEKGEFTGVIHPKSVIDMLLK